MAGPIRPGGSMPRIRTGDFDCWYVEDCFADPWLTPETIVIQHGFGRNGEYWRPWVPALARHYRVIRRDMRAHGGSSAGPSRAPVVGGGPRRRRHRLPRRPRPRAGALRRRVRRRDHRDRPRRPPPGAPGFPHSRADAHPARSGARRRHAGQLRHLVRSPPRPRPRWLGDQAHATGPAPHRMGARAVGPLRRRGSRAVGRRDPPRRRRGLSGQGRRGDVGPRSGRVGPHQPE